ncbi:hypothetical protein GCM10014715_63390 [Streptomyces spiralis]|uniref:Uncharacterized protein n=1 Tax=Streptomyces spiralis TaxID=66376 RepID=A0A919AC78_9ACTN|nr:hypothetical protein GCM10014715_63390 [Streptomyces spiralis]
MRNMMLRIGCATAPSQGRRHTAGAFPPSGPASGTGMSHVAASGYRSSSNAADSRISLTVVR